MINEILKTLDKAVVYDIKTYDMKDKTPFYDYSIICSAGSTRQAIACVEYLRDDARINGYNVLSYSKEEDAKWCLVDLDEIVVHIFVGDERERYNLDAIYGNK